MTKYTSEELDKNWEFKIVRSLGNAFHRPEVFQALLQEESIAGWELVEKLDDRRVRFKRPRDARRKDINLPPGYDPYRSTYGSTAIRNTSLVIGILAMVLVMGISLLGIFSNGATGFFTEEVISAIIMVFILVIVIASLIARKKI